MAAKQPVAKNIGLFKTGIPLHVFWAKFGQTLISEEANGKWAEIFTIIQGYSKLAETGRAISRGIAESLH